LHQLGIGTLLLALPTLGVVTAFGVAPSTVVHRDARVPVVEAIPLPDFAPAEPGPARYFARERVQKGDTVAALFERLGVHDSAAIEFLKTDRKGTTLFRKLVPGKTLQAETDRDGQLLSLRYFLGGGLLEVTRTATGFAARDRALTEAPRIYHRSAEIRSSLFAATDAAGIPDAVAMQIARVFSTDIDFHTDLRKGDRFSVVYEMQHEAGELVAPGRILAAQFTNDGRRYDAVLFVDEEGRESHFDFEGNNRAKAFLRSPVEFSRVSSGFGARFHPIFRNWRAHTGVDFAAPKGTRVLAAADGHVIGVGWRNGYGKTIEVKHGGSISTLYAHLSGFAPGVRNGARVRQGDAIGYVGATGYATGPHLHYEFKISGMHQDPMKVALPKATPVPHSQRPKFELAAAEARGHLTLAATAAPNRFE
jgi:murein DD-endopeptidase MepM/ murein hydrolase activator NlpD